MRLELNHGIRVIDKLAYKQAQSITMLGILRDKTMANTLMYIPNNNTQITPSVDYNQLLKRLDTQLNEPTNQNSIISAKVANPKNKTKLWGIV